VGTRNEENTAVSDAGRRDAGAPDEAVRRSLAGLRTLEIEPPAGAAQRMGTRPGIVYDADTGKVRIEMFKLPDDSARDGAEVTDRRGGTE
jgi:hypothetical protein